jgi:hypothetical protein
MRVEKTKGRRREGKGRGGRRREWGGKKRGEEGEGMEGEEGIMRTVPFCSCSDAYGQQLQLKAADLNHKVHVGYVSNALIIEK